MKDVLLIFIRALFLTAIICATRPAKAESLKISGKTMGTYYSIVIDSAPQSRSDEIRTKVEACLANVNRQMSTWDPESEISQFNRLESTDWFAVSPEFAAVVQESIRIHKLTDGAFDPTVAPLIDLWGFGSKRAKKFPTEEEIDAALKTIGMRFIEARAEPPAVRKSRSEISLNLSAIAKGHGVDRVSLLLTTMGHPSHVVDIGGENRTGTAKADGGKWRLGVESPIKPEEGFYRVIEVTETSVATSGDYRNYFEINGVRHCHIIDPLAGRPVANPPASVCVLSDSCMTADAFATAMMVMGTRKGVALAKQENISVMFLDVVGNQDLEVIESSTGEFKNPVESATDAALANPEPASHR